MGVNIYKVPYECDCGCDYGSCGAKCAVILKEYRSTDTYALFHTDSHSGELMKKGEPVTTPGGLTYFGEAYSTALFKALKGEGDTPLTEEEKKVVLPN